MNIPLVEHILTRLDEVKSLYHRLLLLVGEAGTANTALLYELSDASRTPIVNINLELSRRMLELTEHQRALRAHGLMKEILADMPNEVVILDRIEILYDPQLKVDPLRLLQDLSRSRTIVAVWSGSVKGNHLLYAEPGHPEFRRYPIHELQIIGLDNSQ